MLFISSKELQINFEIRDSEVRVVDDDGSQLGILKTKEALELAHAKNMDLVKIAPLASPCVCRIMNYGKYRFELGKKEKEAKKNQKVITIKEIRFSPSIDTHDFTTKLNQAIKFLTAKSKVKVAVRFRGRELNHTEIGRQLLLEFGEKTEEVSLIEKPPKMEGRNMVMFLSPK